MSILIKFYTVVTRIETIEKKYPGGLHAYIKDNRVGKSYRDEHIVGVLFMSLNDVEAFIDKLINLGFTYIVNKSYDEIALVDMFVGPLWPCAWLEASVRAPINKVKEPTCWLKENKIPRQRRKVK